MEQKNIMLITDKFLQPPFSVKDAVRMFGPIKDDTLPNWIILDPKIDNVELVKLEYIEIDDGDAKEKFLASILIRFIDTIHISFPNLYKEFGKPDELVRLHPDSDIPYRFKIDGKPLKGALVLYVKGRTSKDLQPVHSIKFVRYPKE
ncbi:MAG: hypothetical protein GXP49_02980 [Deltaproteobacteria bacterium]|nr:hypothetical protein [Deltaproteobacteria bacterium]